MMRPGIVPLALIVLSACAVGEAPASIGTDTNPAAGMVACNAAGQVPVSLDWPRRPLRFAFRGLGPCGNVDLEPVGLSSTDPPDPVMGQEPQEGSTAIATVVPPPAAAEDAQGHPAHDHAAMLAAQQKKARGWQTMLHGYAFVNVNRQGGPSGESDFESQNHMMASAWHPWLKGTFSLLGMFTIEPATIDSKGSPELFQRGETYRGKLLVDWQHPHELFAQLGAQWEKDLSPQSPGTTSFRVFAGLVGEPALGPTAFVHRLSASENPTAPLAHHNQDSTHISSDVVTAALTISRVTVEASAFNGKEPDSHRWDIDQGPIDSYSGRIWLRPMKGLSIQISAGRREEPEELEEGDQTRQTASIEYERPTQRGFVAGTLAVGRNKLHGGTVEWGSTLEGTWKFLDANFLYSRIERVDRDLAELILKEQRPESVPFVKTLVSAATLGYVRDFPLISKIETGAGADATIYNFTSRLDDVYGEHPVSVHAFLRLRFQAGSTHPGDAGHMGHQH